MTADGAGHEIGEIPLEDEELLLLLLLRAQSSPHQSSAPFQWRGNSQWLSSHWLEPWGRSLPRAGGQEGAGFRGVRLAGSVAGA